MKNVTIAIDEETLRRGRKYAHDHGTSLNALLRNLLGQTVNARRQGDWESLFRLMDQAGGNSRGRRWSREDVYDA
jgi:hypothetical protein